MSCLNGRLVRRCVRPGAAERSVHVKTAPTWTHPPRERYVILANGQSLMSSRMHGSRRRWRPSLQHARLLDAPAVLIGGLGMGFTLAPSSTFSRPRPGGRRRADARRGRWNRGPLGPADHPSKDPRVQRLGDVAATLRAIPPPSTPCSLTSTTGRPLSRLPQRFAFTRSGSQATAATLRPT